jgi:hypothetical protein
MGVGSVVGGIFVIPWLRSRFATEHLMLIAQITLAVVYVLIAMVHHCLYCLIPMALAGASWTLVASELWVIAQRAIPNSARGRISALIMVLSQGAMTLRNSLGHDRTDCWYSIDSLCGCPSLLRHIGCFDAFLKFRIRNSSKH